jgi:DDE family transposase
MPSFAGEGRFFHGYDDGYCYLPLYVFCGRRLLAAKLRPANIDASAGSAEEIARIVAQIRARWPRVRILLRADSGFARESLMAWRQQNRVDFVFGLARNARLVDGLRRNSQFLPNLESIPSLSRPHGVRKIFQTENADTQLVVSY